MLITYLTFCFLNLNKNKLKRYSLRMNEWEGKNGQKKIFVESLWAHAPCLNAGAFLKHMRLAEVYI